MGYFNIYYILRDLIKNIFNKKVFIAFLIIVFCFVVFSKINISFGSDAYNLTYVWNNTPQNLVTDFPNNSVKLNNTEISSVVWQWEHVAFLNYQVSNPTLEIILWNGDLYLGAGVAPSQSPNDNTNAIYVDGTWARKIIDFRQYAGNIPAWFSGSTYYTQNTAYIITGNAQYSSNSIVCANGNIYDRNHNIIYHEPVVFNPPYFLDPDEITSGNPNGVVIEPGDFTSADTFYFHLMKVVETVPSGESGSSNIYYYSSRIFALDIDSPYFTVFDGDNDHLYDYYYIDKSALNLDPDSTYLFMLSSSGDFINNSIDYPVVDLSSGIYSVLLCDTSGVITPIDSSNNKLDNIQDSLTSTTPSPDIDNDVDDSLDFDNKNTALTNLNNGFFSRLTSLFNSLIGYDLGEDTTIEVPMPNSQEKIVLHSNILYNYVTGPLRLIINAFWIYLFTFYLWRFINKIYIAVSSGTILQDFSSKGETITNDML